MEYWSNGTEGSTRVASEGVRYRPWCGFTHFFLFSSPPSLPYSNIPKPSADRRLMQ